MSEYALDVRPAHTSHAPGAPVVLLVDLQPKPQLDVEPDVELDGETYVEVEVTRLGRPVRTVRQSLLAARSQLDLGAFDQGSYAVSARFADRVASTAFDVLPDANARPRYGFVTDFRPGRTDSAAVADSLRSFHLTHVQFYDWMYRHAELLPPSDEFVDTLGRDLSLAVVRDFVGATHDAGAQALAYAAVYAAGKEYAALHPEQLVHHVDGTPWMLGDFLWNTDLRPGSDWSRHIVDEMGRAVEQVGFDGLHLDQYGDPKLATTADGVVVDFAEAFPVFIDAVRDRLPDATLIFNNVNDFPTRTTVRAQQDATYIEVWSPHDHHADLVDLVRRARDLAPTRPVILAAYLEPFAEACGPDEVATAKLALATTWAEGGQYLLFGERDGALVHPYYPNYATLNETAVQTLRRFADFSVACGDLLFDPALRECTTNLMGGINLDVVVEGVPTSTYPTSGAVWVRVSASGARLVVQLVDFRTQHDGRWNHPRQQTGECAAVTVRVRAATGGAPAWFGHPMGGPGLTELSVARDGEYHVVELPSFDTWGLLVIDR
ncbi:MAG TPA: glycoside hydrolase family 66 protein [Pedococcus sp.]|nr:glycoside hydrolase family 66 protein [Pedococcus sp.]